MKATPGTSAIRNDRIHNKFVKYAFILFFVSLFDSFLMIASRQTIVFIIHNAIIFVIIAFIVLIRLSSSPSLYVPFLFVLGLAFLAEILFIAIILFTCAFLCSNHDGCVNATIYYVINIVTRIILAATIYNLTKYAWLAYKQDKVAQDLVEKQQQVAVDTQTLLSSASASRFATVPLPPTSVRKVKYSKQ